MTKENNIQNQLALLQKQERRIRALIRLKKRRKRPHVGELSELTGNLLTQHVLLKELLDINKRDIEDIDLRHATDHRKMKKWKINISRKICYSVTK